MLLDSRFPGRRTGEPGPSEKPALRRKPSPATSSPQPLRCAESEDPTATFSASRCPWPRGESPEKPRSLDGVREAPDAAHEVLATEAGRRCSWSENACSHSHSHSKRVSRWWRDPAPPRRRHEHRDPHQGSRAALWRPGDSIVRDSRGRARPTSMAPLALAPVGRATAEHGRDTLRPFRDVRGNSTSRNDRRGRSGGIAVPEGFQAHRAARDVGRVSGMPSATPRPRTDGSTYAQKPFPGSVHPGQFHLTS